MGHGTPVATRQLFTTRPNGDAYSTTRNNEKRHANTMLVIKLTIYSGYCINLKGFRCVVVEQFVIAFWCSRGGPDGCHGVITLYSTYL